MVIASMTEGVRKPWWLWSLRNNWIAACGGTYTCRYRHPRNELSQVGTAHGSIWKHSGAAFYSRVSGTGGMLGVGREHTRVISQGPQHYKQGLKWVPGFSSFLVQVNKHL